MKRALSIAVPCIALVAVVGWRIFDKKSTDAKTASQQKARQTAPANDEAVVAAARDILQGIEIVGTVESPQNVKLSPKAVGRIDFLEVREGDAVKAGQVLVKIDPTEVEGEVLQDRASLAAAQSRLAQAKITQGPNDVGVLTQIRQMQAGVDSANADYLQTKQNYDAQVATFQSGVTDAAGRVQSAQSTIDSAQADLESAQANLENSSSKLARVLSLFKLNYIAAQDVDDAKTAEKVASSAVNAAKQRLSGTRSALRSSEAQERAAQDQLAIYRRKGLSDIAASKAKRDQAQASLDLANSNRAQTPAYQDNLAALQATVDAADGTLRQAQSRLTDTQLVSPIDGTVTSRTADPGTIAQPGQPVVTIDFLKWLYVTASIPIDQSANVAVGQRADIEIDALPGQTLTGTLSKVNPSADPTSRQFTVKIALDNPQGRIRPGMYGRVKIVTHRVRAAIVVPLEAVRSEGSTKAVYVVDDSNVAHRREVTTGQSDSKGVEILRGVNAGEKVITLSYQAPRDGMKVNLARGGKP